MLQRCTVLAAVLVIGVTPRPMSAEEPSRKDPTAALLDKLRKPVELAPGVEMPLQELRLFESCSVSYTTEPWKGDTLNSGRNLKSSRCAAQPSLPACDILPAEFPVLLHA